MAFTYFNSNLNSTANWALSTDAKKTQFKTELREDADALIRNLSGRQSPTRGDDQ